MIRQSFYLSSLILLSQFIKTHADDRDICNVYLLSQIDAHGITCNDVNLLSLNTPFGLVTDPIVEFANCTLDSGTTVIQLDSYVNTNGSPYDKNAVHVCMSDDEYSFSNCQDFPTYPNWSPLPVPLPSKLDVQTVVDFATAAPSGLSSCALNLRFHFQSTDARPVYDSCTMNSEADCLNHYGQTSNNCKYDFTAGYCSASVTDACQQYSDDTTCSNNGCFWDPYLANCLASLPQINSVFTCNYWTAYSSSTTNLACDFHACQYDANARKCINSGETPSQPILPTVGVQAEFINPVVDINNQTLSLQVVVPFVYTDTTPTDPKFPDIQILFPATDFSIYGTEDIPACSSYKKAGAFTPAPFTTTQNDTAVNNFIIQSIAQNHDFTFNQSNPLGVIANKSLGEHLVGPDQRVKSVEYNGTHFFWNVSLDLVETVAKCAQRGATYVNQAGARVYTIPVSYMEHNSDDVFNQLTETFTITMPTTGVATIGSQSSYGFQAFPIQVQTVRGTDGGCETNEAKLQMTFKIETYNVYDPNYRIGFFSSSDVLMRAPDSPPGPMNCYGDFWFLTTTLTCDYKIGMCSTTLKGSTACRVVTDDGNAFKYCSYAKDADRIADMGSDIPYPTSLDGIHTFWIYRRACSNDNGGDLSACRIVSPNNLPEQITAKMLPSIYTDTTRTANDFQVTAGFLPSIDSPLDTQPSGVTVVNGIITYTVTASSILSIFAAMDTTVRTRYDLRSTITTGATRVIGMTADGFPLSTVSGYTGLTELNYQQIRARVLTTTKDDYYAGCGVAGICRLLPACVDILGCDGFSIPVGQLRALMPADSYQIVMPYRIGLLNSDGSSPIARRRLLQTTTDQQRIGTATFRILIVNGNIQITNSTYGNGTLVTVDVLSTLGTDGTQAKKAVTKGNVVEVALAIVGYFVISYSSKLNNKYMK